LGLGDAQDRNVLNRERTSSVLLREKKWYDACSQLRDRLDL